jgi:Carbohydrate-binding module family 5/12
MKVLSMRGRTRWIAAGSAALVATGGIVAATIVAAAPANAAVIQVAPYVDMSNNQEPMLNSAATQAGLHNYTAAFVIGSGCTPIWGDTLPVTNDPTMDQEIATARSDGATPIVSFGGAGGSELALTCTTASSLQAAYQSVISHLGVNHIDFDIEGATLDYTANNNVRFQAINGLEAANPGLVVSVTLPVLPTGLASDGVAFLNLAKQDGTRIDLINVMAMDYGSSFTGDMGQEAIQAAQSTLGQARADWSGDSYANIGVTPMIGQNDTSGEIFTEADAQTLVSWASSNGIGRLAFWSVDRDQPCGGSANGLPSCSEISQSALDFTKIFLGGGGNGGNPSPSTSPSHSPSPSPSPSGSTGGSCYPAWNANTSYVPGDNVSYNGENYTSLYWSTGVTPGSAIAWNIWKPVGAC